MGTWMKYLLAKGLFSCFGWDIFITIFTYNTHGCKKLLHCWKGETPILNKALYHSNGVFGATQNIKSGEKSISNCFSAIFLHKFFPFCVISITAIKLLMPWSMLDSTQILISMHCLGDNNNFHKRFRVFFCQFFFNNIIHFNVSTFIFTQIIKFTISADIVVN